MRNNNIVCARQRFVQTIFYICMYSMYWVEYASLVKYWAVILFCRVVYNCPRQCQIQIIPVKNHYSKNSLIYMYL